MAFSSDNSALQTLCDIAQATVDMAYIIIIITIMIQLLIIITVVIVIIIIIIVEAQHCTKDTIKIK